MHDDQEDEQLGMGRRITRRDFVNGAALAVGGSLISSGVPTRASQIASADGAPGSAPGSAPEKASGYYPPALQGMRGNHDGTYTYAHKLRDGDFWEGEGKPQPTEEKYDLVVVGGGISGLAAAYFFRKHADSKVKGSKAKILILDNHDDFGGHAKRNEFRVGDRLLLSNGGTQSIENPSEYSQVSKDLLKELGIEASRFYQDYDQNSTKNWARLASLTARLLGKIGWSREWDRYRGPSSWRRLRSPKSADGKSLASTPKRSTTCRAFPAPRNTNALPKSAMPISSRRSAKLRPKSCHFFRPIPTISLLLALRPYPL